MGQFSVTIYGATGSVLSDIQHSTLLALLERLRIIYFCGSPVVICNLDDTKPTDQAEDQGI